MLMAARKLQGIGLVLLVLILAMTLYPVSLRVASKRSELARVERDIRYTRDNIRYLETELGARASLRQLERWNSENFAYSAPTAGQYLDGERQLANLGSFDAEQQRLAVVAPVQAATAMIADAAEPVGAAAVASDTQTAQAAILATQIKASVANNAVTSSEKPRMKVVVAAKPTARDRYDERARMIDTLLEKESPVAKTAAPTPRPASDTKVAAKKTNDNKVAAKGTEKTEAKSAAKKVEGAKVAAAEPKKPSVAKIADKKADVKKPAVNKVASVDKAKGAKRP